MMFLLNILPSFYLMRLIDEITLSTLLQKIMVVFYFEVLLCALLFFTRKRIRHLMSVHKKYFIGGMIVICGLSWMLGHKYIPLNYLDNKISIEIDEGKNKDAQGQEIWLTGVRRDGKLQSLMECVDDLCGWNWSGTALVGTYGESGILDLVLSEANEITLEFGMHQWSGIAEVKNEESKQLIDLYNSESNTEVMSFKGNVIAYGKVENILLLLGQILLWVELFVMAGEYLTRKELER